MKFLPPLRRRKAEFSWTRTLLHFPVGVITALAIAMGMWTDYTAIGIALGVIIFAAFLAYEISEDIRIRDEMYIDVAGLVAGLCGTVGVLLTLSLCGII